VHLLTVGTAEAKTAAAEALSNLTADEDNQVLRIGHVWSHLVTFGHGWSLLVTVGHCWSLLVTFGHVWSLLVTFGHVW
jgi:hypothetical protein